jgi:hypothetical protein
MLWCAGCRVVGAGRPPGPAVTPHLQAAAAQRLRRQRQHAQQARRAGHQERKHVGVGALLADDLAGRGWGGRGEGIRLGAGQRAARGEAGALLPSTPGLGPSKGAPRQARSAAAPRRRQAPSAAPSAASPAPRSRAAAPGWPARRAPCRRPAPAAPGPRARPSPRPAWRQPPWWSTRRGRGGPLHWGAAVRHRSRAAAGTPSRSTAAAAAAARRPRAARDQRARRCWRSRPPRGRPSCRSAAAGAQWGAPPRSVHNAAKQLSTARSTLGREGAPNQPGQRR